MGNGKRVRTAFGRHHVLNGVGRPRQDPEIVVGWTEKGGLVARSNRCLCWLRCVRRGRGLFRGALGAGGREVRPQRDRDEADYARRLAFGLAFGTTRLRLTLPLFRALAVPLPPLTEQHRIVAEVDRLLSTADETEQTLRAQLARAARLRQAVLKHAFEGKLVPQDPNDEPATALLARLRAHPPPPPSAAPAPG